MKAITWSKKCKKDVGQPFLCGFLDCWNQGCKKEQKIFPPQKKEKKKFEQTLSFLFVSLVLYSQEESSFFFSFFLSFFLCLVNFSTNQTNAFMGFFSFVWCNLLKTRVDSTFKSPKNVQVVYLCFFITQPPCRMTLKLRHNACSSLLGTRERFTCWTRVTYLGLKKKGEERGKKFLARFSPRHSCVLHR